MKRFLQMDLFAGVAAMGWAVSAVTWLPELTQLVSAEAAGTFALLALARGYAAVKAAGSGAK